MLNYPAFNPVLFQIGPLKIHWYGMLYLIGFSLCYFTALHRNKKWGLGWQAQQIQDLLYYIALGVILGGRIGYVLFYTKGAFLHDILMFLRIYEGGMSFHGGLIGVGIAMYLFCKKYNCAYLKVTDFAAQFVPIGLACGRLGNFVNAELWGKATNMPWGIVFPYPDNLARHPTQLYEFFLEGVVLFFILTWFAKRNKSPGSISALFLIFYSIFRIFIEFWRVPDQQFGYIAFGWLTIGQLYCIPMIMTGIYLIKSKKNIIGKN